MVELIYLFITALAAVSREIREWIKLRKEEKDDEPHPPFLTYSSLMGQHFILDKTIYYLEFNCRRSHSITCS